MCSEINFSFPFLAFLCNLYKSILSQKLTISGSFWGRFAFIEKDVLGKDVSVEWYTQIDKKDYAEILSEADAIITTPWAPLSSEMIKHAKK